MEQEAHNRQLPLDLQWARRAGVKRMKKEPRSSAARNVISLQAFRAAKERSTAERSASAKKAMRTKGQAHLRIQEKSSSD